MPLTKQQLLIPRVLCIGTEDGKQNYPKSLFKSGQVIELDNISHDGRNCYVVPSYDIDYFLSYPNCFNPLPWWEGRIVEEMPKYVRFTIDSNGTVHKKDEVVKILGWHDDETGEGNLYFTYENDPKVDLGQYPYLYQPADEADYQEYQKQKEA